MNTLHNIVVLTAGLLASTQMQAQDKIINPDISYAGTPRTFILGGINVTGVEGYEDYVLTGISGLTVGQNITVPGTDISDAVKRYWRHGLFQRLRWRQTLLWVISCTCILVLLFVLASLPSIMKVLRRAKERIWSRNLVC